MAQIKIKRGPSSSITSLNLEQGELAYTTDTKKLYVGNADGTKTMINPDAALIESIERLTTKRKFSAGGDATASAVEFDGTQDVTLTLTLKEIGVTPGTYKSVTVDGKGRVTAGVNPTTAAGYGITDVYTVLQIDGKLLVVEGRLDDIEAIAKGASRGTAFDTVAVLDSWLSVAANKATLKVGDNLYTRTLDTPDYWWDGTAKQPLGTEKVDLTNIYTKTEIAALLADKVPSSRKINGKALSADITITAADIGALGADSVIDGGMF